MNRIIPTSYGENPNHMPIGGIDWTDARKDKSGNEKLHHFSVSWDNLEYDVEASKLDLLLSKIRGKPIQQRRSVLRNLNGSFFSGKMTALMGPSGAGKTTLLECLAGIRRKNRSGLIQVHGRRRVSIGLIPQKDHLHQHLTVREAISYASQLQNSRILEDESVTSKDAEDSEERSTKIEPLKRPKVDHDLITKTLISDLGLEVCADTRIGDISGGQLKRVSIGQELVSKPDILILDEPTSGLDSSSCLATVELLYQLTQKTEPIAILMTIHQPPARIFNLFDKVYILSVIGKPIYEGSPKDVVETLASFDVECSQFYNPADLLIEVASGDYGLEVVNNMAAKVIKTNRGILPTLPLLSTDTLILDMALLKPITPFLIHFVVLWQRLSLITLRDPMMSALRFFFAFNASFSISLIYVDLTKGDGCPPKIEPNFGLDGLNTLTTELSEIRKQTFENIAAFYFILLYTVFGNILPTATSYPLEIMIFQKERYNGWYSPMSYSLAKLLIDIPFVFATNMVVLVLFFWITDQPFDRFVATFVIYFLLALVAVSHGSLVGIIFRYNVVASVFTAPNSGIPFALFSGFFIRPSVMPKIFSGICRFVYLYYGFIGYIVAIFGFNRCNSSDIGDLLTMRKQFAAYLAKMFGIAFEEMRNVAYDDEEVPVDIITEDNNRKSLLVKAIVSSFAGDQPNVTEADFQSGPMMYYDLHDYDYFVAVFGLTMSFIVIRATCIYLLSRLATLRE